MAAIRDAALTAASRYPDVEAEALRRKIAAFHRVAPEHVVLGCGSGDILRIAIHAFVGAHKKLVVAVPTFESIGGWAQRAGATVVGVPLRSDYTHDLDGMLARSTRRRGWSTSAIRTIRRAVSRGGRIWRRFFASFRRRSSC